MMEQACGNLHLLIQAELDGELDAAGAATLVGHLESCPGCTHTRKELGALSTQLRGGGLTRHAAPLALRAAVTAQVAPPKRRQWRGGSHVVSFGAGLAVAASMAWLLLAPLQDTAVRDIVDAHVRALQPGHLVDVPSSDQHTVKPWFDGRIDFAPSVPNLAISGFPLLGGRLDYLDGRPMAALVYGRDKHLIDVFVRPGAPARSATLHGYNIVGWVRDGIGYEAVSDLNLAELSMFAHLMQASP